MDFKALINSVGISEEDFNKMKTDTIEIDADRELKTFSYEQILQLCPKVSGNPYGTFNDKIEFMKWVVETPYVREGSSFLKTALDNYGKEITTEFLQNLTNLAEPTTRRIRDFRKKIGYQVVPMNHYYREFVLTQSKTEFTSYGYDKSGKMVFNSRGASVGNFTRRNTKKIFQKWIPNSDYRTMMESLEELEKRVIEKDEDKHYFKEITLNNLFCMLEGKAGKKLNKPLTETEYKAIYKIQHGKPKYLMKKCEYCNALMKFPLMPNMENDKHEKLAWYITTAFLNRVEGVILCKNCVENIWDEAEILDMVSGLDNGKMYQLPMDLFCETFRKDKKVKDCFDVERDVGKILKKAGRKVSVEENLITIL